MGDDKKSIEFVAKHLPEALCRQLLDAMHIGVIFTVTCVEFDPARHTGRVTFVSAGTTDPH